MVVRLYLGAVGLVGLEKIIQKFWDKNQNLIKTNFPNERSIQEYLLPALKHFKDSANGIQLDRDREIHTLIDELFALDSPDLTICRPKLLCPISSVEDKGRFYRIDEKFTAAVQNVFSPNELELHFSILPMYDYFLALPRTNPLLAGELKNLTNIVLSWSAVLEQLSKLFPSSKIVVWDMEGGELILDEMLSSLFEFDVDDCRIIWPNQFDKVRQSKFEIMPSEWQERHDEEYDRDLFKLATVNNITVMTRVAIEFPSSMGKGGQ